MTQRQIRLHFMIDSKLTQRNSNIDIMMIMTLMNILFDKYYSMISSKEYAHARTRTHRHTHTCTHMHARIDTDTDAHT